MVVAPQPEAAQAGADVLDDDGNAVDAAVATALVQGVVDPLMCGLAGFGSMAVYSASDQHAVYADFHARAPLQARPDMWADVLVGEADDGFGFIVEDNVNEIGYQSICVPAALHALHESHARFGRLPWDRLVEPAIHWAEDGWIVRPNVSAFFNVPEYMGHASNRERLGLTPAGRALYLGANGRPVPIGTRIRNGDLADVLRVIARHGASAFYEGELAETMVSDIRAHGGLLDLDDLRNCEVRWQEPLCGNYRGRRVLTNRPPGGGAMLLQMLQVLEHFDLVEFGHNSTEYVRIVSEAMRQATVDKDTWLGDPEFVDVPLDEVLSPKRSAEIAARIGAGHRVNVPRLARPTEAKDTTHVSVVDRDGNCVSLTHSLGLPSGVVTPGLGFMYNGAMASFDPRPGRTHSVAPGKARFSSIMPTIILGDAGPELVIGAPGGTQIAMGVLQVILNVLDFGCSMLDAVVRPRFSATNDGLDVVNRLSWTVTRELEDLGYKVTRYPMSYGVAWVHSIAVGSDGTLEGAADPACDGVALSGGFSGTALS